MKTIAAITIGQAPRDDVIAELALVVPGVRWLQAGALDGLDMDQIAALEPEPGDLPLVTRLRDGTVVTLGETRLLRPMQHAVDRVDASADLILVCCAGTFPLSSRVPVLLPGRLLVSTVQALHLDAIAVVTPHEGQIAWEEERWMHAGISAHVVVEPPYVGGADFTRLGRAARVHGARAIVMDCFGYTLRARDEVAAASGLPTILIRSLAARIAAELIGEGAGASALLHAGV
jgi:protein AroM